MRKDIMVVFPCVLVVSALGVILISYLQILLGLEYEVVESTILGLLGVAYIGLAGVIIMLCGKFDKGVIQMVLARILIWLFACIAVSTIMFFALVSDSPWVEKFTGLVVGGTVSIAIMYFTFKLSEIIYT